MRPVASLFCWLRSAGTTPSVHSQGRGAFCPPLPVAIQQRHRPRRVISLLDKRFPKCHSFALEIRPQAQNPTAAY